MLALTVRPMFIHIWTTVSEIEGNPRMSCRLDTIRIPCLRRSRLS